MRCGIVIATRARGPMVSPSAFLKDFWSELKDGIMRFMSEFHRNGKLSKGINSTFITLIPKVDSPQKLNDFRLVVDSVISEAQSAFVKDRQILDGILLANEVVDEAKKHKKELLLFK
ncbi:cysteine-rich receptor-like protein kinase, partial [Trifolium medium]|nr:cysteine-rich receptor-like protein kinase [Trifolium medium]